MPACPKMRLLLHSVARASLEQFCRKVEQHPKLLPYHLASSGHWLDKASVEWKANRARA